MPILSLKNISKYYGPTPVLKNLSLNVSTGHFMCLLGSSGSGKTTLLRLIAGLENLDDGEIIINEKLCSKGRSILIPPANRDIGFIFQDLALWPHMTVFENIAFGLKVQKAPNIKSTIEETLEFLGISDQTKKYPSQLSGGQQQLVAIARSLVLNPKILVMDEPLANLDVKLKSKIRNQIKELTKKFAVTIVYVTHDHLEAFLLADDIAVIHQGNIKAIGTPDEIKKSDDEDVRAFIEF